MEIKGTYHCQTTNHPNTLNSWDIRSVSVEMPEVQDKPYWIRVGAMVIGFILVMLAWYLVFGVLKKECCHRAATLEHSGKKSRIY